MGVRRACLPPPWSCEKVTVFLIVTALLDVALGFGLAIYLGRARAPWSPPLDAGGFNQDLQRAETVDGLSESPAVDPLSAPAAVPAQQEEADSRTAATVAVSSSPAMAASPAADSASEPEELEEEDVLAGIVEFRNQLAQMKTQPFGDDSTKSTSALAAR
jgi:hypothetical protein